MADVANSKLLHLDTGILKKDACVVLVKTEWNAAIVDELEKGAIRVLQANGVAQIIRVSVPGAVEIPFAVKKIWDSADIGKKPDAFITLYSRHRYPRRYAALRIRVQGSNGWCSPIKPYLAGTCDLWCADG